VVAISLPFLLVRTVYSALSAFTHSLNFNILIGSVSTYLSMAVLEEFAIFILFLSIGFTLRIIPNGVVTEAGKRTCQYGKLSPATEGEIPRIINADLILERIQMVLRFTLMQV